MGDIILGELICKASCVEERRFDGLITIHYGSDNVTYQMARSHPMFKHLSNAQCNKIKSLLKDLVAKKSTKLVKYRSSGILCTVHIQNFKKTVINGQARSREASTDTRIRRVQKEAKEQKPEAKPQSNPVKEKSIIGQQKSTRPIIFHFNPQSFTKVQK
ncbi:hypothetical protein Tco_1004550 [Tanacetum coccineum]|uniref:Uncharacterized protein n=1 Tax=Tanacetum coccineum TaxID=301880 RepID=A0ABQ5FE55_9ASTR